MSAPIEPASVPARSHSPFAPFRHRAFRAIWTANLASNIGSIVQSVAAAWLMTGLTRSHQLIALVQSSTSLPVLLLGVIAGAIADGFDRRRVMLFAQTLMLAVSAVLAVVTWAGAIGPGLLLAFTLAVGCGTALNGPAWQASVRLHVSPEDLPQAISLNAIAFNLARSLGPAAGGALIALTSPALAFALNALSYLALIVVLLRWRPDAPAPRREPIVASIAAGIGFCLGSSPVRRVLLRGFAFGLGAAGYHALLPSIVRDRLHGSEIDYGLSLAAFGVGSVVAALWVGAARRRWGSEAVLAVAMIGFAAMLVPVALAHSLGQILVAALFAGGCWVACFTTFNVAVQLRAPEPILGRCLSLYQATSFGGLALGAWLVGLIGDRVGVSEAVLSAAAWLAGAALVLRMLAPMPGREEGRVAAL